MRQVFFGFLNIVRTSNIFHGDANFKENPFFCLYILNYASINIENSSVTFFIKSVGIIVFFIIVAPKLYFCIFNECSSYMQSNKSLSPTSTIKIIYQQKIPAHLH